MSLLKKIQFVCILLMMTVSGHAQQDLGRITNFSDGTLRNHYMDICLTLKFYQNYRPGLWGDSLHALDPNQAEQYLNRFLCTENGAFKSHTQAEGVGIPNCNSSNSRLMAMCEAVPTFRDNNPYRMPENLQPSELQMIGRMLKEFAEHFRSGFWDDFDAASQMRDFGYGNTFHGTTVSEPLTESQNEDSENPDPEKSDDPSEVMM